MSDFLLIHGSCHGAWCWKYFIPALERLGHRARAIDLPGNGTVPGGSEPVTLDLYARAILDEIPDSVTLVGHSMAGYPITAAAELAPAKIDRLIYLCAYVPMPGKTLAEMRRMAATQPLIDAVIVDRARGTFTIDPEKAAAKFFHDVAPDRAAWAVAMLGPQPILPQETPLWPDKSRAVPRRYIICEDDRTIPPEFQAEMTADWPTGHVARMASSHSPFLSDPEGLARLLVRLATD